MPRGGNFLGQAAAAVPEAVVSVVSAVLAAAVVSAAVDFVLEEGFSCF
jgi:hypothetical protein